MPFSASGRSPTVEMPPNWAATPTGNPEAARRPHTPAADAQAPRSRERGPGLRPGPFAAARSSGLQHSATGQRAEGRLRTDGGGAASSPARTSVAVSPPRAEREQQQVFRGRLGRLQQGSRPQQASTGKEAEAGGALTQHHGQAAAGVRSSGPRDTAATPRGLRAKLPPLPPPSPRSASAAPQPPRDHVPSGERAPSARAGRAAGA